VGALGTTLEKVTECGAEERGKRILTMFFFQAAALPITPKATFGALLVEASGATSIRLIDIKRAQCLRP
jgi:hypothetical protein